MVSETTRHKWHRASVISRRTLLVAAVACVVILVPLSFAPLVPASGRTQFVTIDFGLAVTTIAVAVLCLLALLACAIARWCMAGPARWGVFAPRARRQVLLERFDQASRHVGGGTVLVRVTRVYQVAARGTKCVVEHPWGIHQDAWFWNTRPRSGRVYLVNASNHYGPHNHVANVLYINPGIIETIPSAAWRAARRRQNARLAAARQSAAQ